MTFNLPPVARLTLYILSAIGSVVVAYLVARGFMGEAETAAWAGLVAIINTLSAANVGTGGEHRADTE